MSYHCPVDQIFVAVFALRVVAAPYRQEHPKTRESPLQISDVSIILFVDVQLLVQGHQFVIIWIYPGATVYQVGAELEGWLQERQVEFALP